jgi:hypothetical protein
MVFGERRLCQDQDMLESSSDKADPLDGLTAAQRAWVSHSVALWERAHALARIHPEHDPSDLYHAFRCLELSPTERLRAGLQRGRLRAYAR